METEIKTLIPLIRGPIDKILSSIGNDLKQIATNRLLEFQTETLRRNLFTKTFLHRSVPKCIDDFYEPLYIEKYEKDIPPGGRRTTRIPTNNVKKLFNISNYITIIGNAGSGKSTLTKYLFVTCVRENFKFPIKIELRYLNDYKKESLYDYIIEEVFTFHKLGISVDKIYDLLDSNNFIFFLDGYDELNFNIRGKIAHQIEEFTKRYPNNYYLLTSRPHTDIDTLPLFQNFIVSKLDEHEITSFVRKQLPAEEKELTQKIITSIRKPENRIYAGFLSNPLLLAMFILTFQSYPDIPQERNAFYEQVFDTLFSIHDSMSKLAYVRKKQTNLTKEQFEKILRVFSFLSFYEDQFSFSLRYIKSTFNIIKEKNPSLQFDNSELLYDLQVAIGIITVEGLNYSFPHRSLQEFFAATYIERVSPNNKKKLYEKFIKSALENPTSIIFRDNFYSLLYELDKKYLIRNLLIPLIEKCVYHIKHTSIRQEKYFYFVLAYYSARYLFRDFNFSIYIGPAYFQNLFDSGPFLAANTLELNFYFNQVFETDAERKLHNMRLEKIINDANEFVNTSKQLIEYYNERAGEDDKIDEDIINLL